MNSLIGMNAQSMCIVHTYVNILYGILVEATMRIDKILL